MIKFSGNHNLWFMNMKKILPIGFVFSITMASCLKDTPYMDVSNTPPVIEFGQSPAQGLQGPFPYDGDMTAPVDTAIALVLASPQVETDTLQTIVQIDPSQVSTFNEANGTSYTALSDDMYTITDTVNILPGFRVGILPVRLKFPGLTNYALPLKIVGSYFLHNNNPVVISSNSGSFMWLF
jgi:Domain of unknown function (DUF1735)